MDVDVGLEEFLMALFRDWHLQAISQLVLEKVAPAIVHQWFMRAIFFKYSICVVIE